MSKPVVITAALIGAVFAVLSARFLLADRDLVAATPSPRPVFKISLIDVPPGEPLCIGDVTIPKDARQIRFQVGTYGRSGPALDVALTAPGYSARVRVPAGYADSALVVEPMNPPENDVLGEVCVRHDGAERIALVGTAEERTRSRPADTVGGRPVDPDAYLAFYENRSAGALGRTPAIIDRMSAFRPGIVGPWLLWPLLVITVFGVPLGVLAAVRHAVRA
jgi:hypothetical protein